MRKKRILKKLKVAYIRGCSCVIYDAKAICGACLAGDILGLPAPDRRSGFAGTFVRKVKETLGRC